MGYANFCRLVQEGAVLNFLPSNLWGYWTDLDQTCTQCSYNIATEYFKIRTAILLIVLGHLANFAQNWLPWQCPFRPSGNEKNGYF